MDSKELWINIELVSFPIMVLYFIIASFYFTQNRKRNIKRFEVARNKDLIDAFRKHNQNSVVDEKLEVKENPSGR